VAGIALESASGDSGFVCGFIGYSVAASLNGSRWTPQTYTEALQRFSVGTRVGRDAWVTGASREWPSGATLARCGPQDRRQHQSTSLAVHAVQRLFAGTRLFVQRKPFGFGSPATTEDFRERPAVHVVAGER
jgi:hypothetical protein